MRLREILTKARALIAKPEKWCRYHQGDDGTGNYVDPWKRGAKQRCALGAISAVLKTMINNDHPAAQAVAKEVGAKSGLAIWNNAHNHAAVLAAFDAAIKATRTRRRSAKAGRQ